MNWTARFIHGTEDLSDAYAVRIEVFCDEQGYRLEQELDELDRLYESLQSALYDNGFSRERKRFRPHITLGRNVEHDELVTEELKRLSPNASVTVQGITLFESARQEGKVVYNPLHRERF